MKIHIKKLHPEAVIPKYESKSAVGMDLTATSIISEDNESIVYGTGLAMEIPEGFGGFVYPRSSVRKQQLVMANSVGLIDPDYRGEVQVSYKKTFFQNTKQYQVGDRVAQIIIQEVPLVQFVEVEELSETERGSGGHGSTGK